MAPKRENIASLSKKVNDLIERVEFLERRLSSSDDKPTGLSIHKVESFNEESVPAPGDGLKMTRNDKIISMVNAIKILNPKLIGSDGRHSAQNIGAICGFKVDHTMMDDAYQKLHTEKKG